MNKLLLVPIALVVAAFIACGGGDKAPGAGFPGTEVAIENTPTPAAATDVPVVEPTAAPTVAPAPTITEEWATEQVVPFTKTAMEALRDQRYNDLYDMLSAESKTLCPRSDYVSNLAGTMLLAEAFGMGEVLEAVLLEIEDGTYQLTFSEISAERISYTAAGDEADEPTTLVFEDGQWRTIDDGTCMEMTWGEGDDEGVAVTDPCTDFTEWNGFSQEERDAYDTNGDWTGLDEWLTMHGCPE